MIIASISENKEFEKRISITPEVAKKYLDFGKNAKELSFKFDWSYIIEQYKKILS